MIVRFRAPPLPHYVHNEYLHFPTYSKTSTRPLRRANITLSAFDLVTSPLPSDSAPNSSARPGFLGQREGNLGL